MVTGHPAGPGRVGVSVCDIACGMSAHAAVLEALIERSRTGRGLGLKISLFDAIADWMNVPLLQFEGGGRTPERMGLAHPTICPYGAFTTADGVQVVIAIQNERENIRASVTVQDKYASGVGKLSANAGRGTWRGYSGTTRCSGYWTAQRS